MTSDGVHDNLTSIEINRILNAQNQPDLASSLIEYARQRSTEGGIHVRAKPDDVSAVVIEVT